MCGVDCQPIAELILIDPNVARSIRISASFVWKNMTRTISNEPIPDYTIRESKRARRVSLKVSSTKGFEVVIPVGFDRTRIPALVAEKREWIQRAIGRVREECSDLDRRLSPPELVNLSPVELQLTHCNKNLRLSEEHDRVFLTLFEQSP